MMKEKLLLILAYDILLSELDGDYVEIRKEIYTMVEGKFYEAYGLSLDANDEDLVIMKDKMFNDVIELRDKLIAEIK